MRKIYFLWYLLLVVAIVIAFDLLFSWTIDKVMNNRYVPTIAKIKDSDSKIAVLGASRASHHYIPHMIEDSLNMSTYNYGIDGRNIFVHYIILEYLINNSKEKPEIILLDLNNTDIYDINNWNTERLNLTYPYYLSSPFVKSTLDDLLESKELFFIKNSGLARHNSELVNDIKALMGKDYDKNQGYIPLFNTWDNNMEIEQLGSENKISSEKIKYLEKFLSRCKEENISAAIALSPSYNNSIDTLWISEIKKSADQYKVPVFDYLHSDYFKNPIFFNDPAHLNDTGAREYTLQIISNLKDKMIRVSEN